MSSIKKLKEVKPVTEEVSNGFNQLFSENLNLDNWVGQFDILSSHLRVADKSFQEFLSTMQKSGTVYKTSEEALAGYQAYLKTTGKATTLATVKTKALSASMKVLSSIGWMVVLTAVTETISLITNTISDAIVTNDEYVETQQKIIDKSNEIISSAQSETEKLEALKKKLDDAKDSKAEWLGLSEDVNDVLGNGTDKLLEEANGYKLLNAKIERNIQLQKDAKEQANKDKNQALEESVSKTEISNSGLDSDVTFSELMYKSKLKSKGIFDDAPVKIVVKDVFSDLLKEKEKNNEVVSTSEDYAKLWRKAIEETDPDDFSLSAPSVEEIKNGFDSMLTDVYTRFEDKINSGKGFLGSEDLKNVIANMFMSGINDFDVIGETLDNLLNNNSIDKLWSQYTDALKDPNIDENVIYDTITSEINDIKKQYPILTQTLDSYMSYMKSTLPEIIDSAATDVESSEKNLKNALESLNKLDLSISGLSDLESAYSTLRKTMEDGLTTDNLETILKMNSEYVNILFDENGQMTDNETAWKNLTKVKIDETKASIYQQAATELQRISALGASDANNELALSNGTLSQSAYDVAHSAYLAALNLGGANAELAKNVWNAAEIKVGLLDKKLKDVSDSTYKVKDSYKNTATEFSKQIDFLSTRLTELDELTNKVSASMDNMVGSASKNNLVDAMFAIDGNRKETLEKGIKLYQDEASKALAKIPAEYRDMAINGSITLGTFEGKGNEDVVQAIEDYRTWSEKVASTTEEIEKLTTAMRQLQVDKFNNIADDYSALTDLISSNTTLLKSQISLLETKGQKVGKSYYTSLIEQNSTYIDILKQERKSLNNQMSSAMANGVKYASEEWQDMYTKIQDVDNSIIEATNSVQEYTNALRDVDVSVFNDITSAISGIKDELSNIIGVLNTEDNVLGDFGGFSADAITSIALYKQQMEASQYEIARTQKEIAKLNDEYANGEWGIQDYTERLQELEEQSWSNVDAYESAKDAILELAKSRVDEEIEAIEESTSAYEDYISKLKDALDAEKKLHDYKKSIEEKQSELTDIQNQINSRLGSDDAATLAEIEKLQSEYAKKVSEIQDLQYDKSIEDQQDALDKQLEDYKKTQEDKKTELEKSLEDTEEIITKTIESVLSNASTVSSKLAEVTKKYGINISKNITDPWKSGNNAISGYQTQLTTSTSVFNTKLDGVSNHIRNLQVTADTMAYQMTKDFNSVSGETLNSTLSRVQSYLAYCSTSSVYLKDQIYNTLNQSYSSKGIVDTFTNVKNSIDNATNSLRNYIDLTRQKNQQKYKLVQTINGINGTQRTTVVRTGVTEAEAYANNISFSPTSQRGATWYKLVAMAKGGVVKKDNEPSTVARSLGEDTLVAAKYGEGVFTKEQTNALLDLAPTLPNFAKYLPTFDISKFVNNVPRINSMPIVNINYDNLISIDGGTITKDSIPDLQELTKNVANNVSQQLAKDLKNNKGWTTNACRPY